MSLNAAWFLLLLEAVMPALGGTAYQHWTYPALGTGPLSATLFIVEHPLKALQLLVTPVEKLRVGFGTFASWLFLPALSPLALVAVPSFLARFWSSSTDLWSFHFQYSMLPAPILAFAAIDSAARLKGWSRGRMPSVAFVGLPIAVLAASALLTVGVVSPLAELGTYISDSTAEQIQGCLNVIPAGASVAATDRLLPHLSDRAQIYEVTTHSDAEYIAIDLSTLGTANPVDDQLRGIVRTALATGYGVSCSQGLTAVIARGSTSGQLSPPMQRWLAGDCTGRACLAIP